MDDSEKAQSIVLTEPSPQTVIEQLPQDVWPVTAKLSLDRSSTHDRSHDEYTTPEYPVEVRQPRGVPYIPESTVYFDNPAERPPGDTKAWRPHEFREAMDEILAFFDEDTAVDTERLYVTGLCVVEIPAQYVRSDDGGIVPTHSLYEEHGEMTLAYFQKESSLSAHRVRSELDEALPGETRTPLQLTQISEVRAKEVKSDRTTRMKSGRTRYFTHSEADKYGKPELTPGIWKLRRITGANEEARPLEPVMSDIDRFAPSLADTDLMQHVTFTGETYEREEFLAENVLTQ
jgi:hypothetical protein